MLIVLILAINRSKANSITELITMRLWSQTNNFHRNILSFLKLLGGLYWKKESYFLDKSWLLAMKFELVLRLDIFHQICNFLFYYVIRKTLRKPSKAYNFLQGPANKASVISILRLESEQCMGFRKTCSKYWWSRLFS